jgi:hypothetical protein
MSGSPARMTAVATIAACSPEAAQTPSAAADAAAGTWRMVSATYENKGSVIIPYSPDPVGMLVFTADMHLEEVPTDPGTPRFASDARGEGTDAENRRAMASSIACFHRHRRRARPVRRQSGGELNVPQLGRQRTYDARAEADRARRQDVRGLHKARGRRRQGRVRPGVRTRGASVRPPLFAQLKSPPAGMLVRGRRIAEPAPTPSTHNPWPSRR